MAGRRWVAAAAAGAVSAAMLLPTTAATAGLAVPAPIVIAIVGESGINVLHDDFALDADAAPAPPVPVEGVIKLPEGASFSERRADAEASTLGALPAGKTFWVEGTRVLLHAVAPPDEPEYAPNVFADRGHGTAVASSAVGRRHGTNPQAWVLMVLSSRQHDPWAWLATQPWVDVMSTSVTSYPGCGHAADLRDIATQGRMVFSAAGNGEQVGVGGSPSGAPDVYQVGGVDAEGRTYLPGPDHQFSAIMPTRPYETGDRFDFPAANTTSTDGAMAFGGTSGASPSTAGRTAHLISVARALLGDTIPGTSGGVIAEAAEGVVPPASGPLADGRLERSELIDVLHRSAVPAEDPSPSRYLLEGYGAFTDAAATHAEAVLRGWAESPPRADEDRMHSTVETARGAAFTGRCDLG